MSTISTESSPIGLIKKKQKKQMHDLLQHTETYTPKIRVFSLKTDGKSVLSTMQEEKTAIIQQIALYN